MTVMKSQKLTGLWGALILCGWSTTGPSRAQKPASAKKFKNAIRGI